MNKASKRWNMLRHSVLERTRREVIEPLGPPDLPGNQRVLPDRLGATIIGAADR